MAPLRGIQFSSACKPDVRGAVQVAASQTSPFHLTSRSHPARRRQRSSFLCRACCRLLLLRAGVRPSSMSKVLQFPCACRTPCGMFSSLTALASPALCKVGTVRASPPMPLLPPVLVLFTLATSWPKERLMRWRHHRQSCSTGDPQTYCRRSSFAISAVRKH